ncbi:MAG: hypothetical protein AB7D57_07130 [Desulfovibrionaceae bacterium]
MLRLIGSICVGLFVGNLIESLNWTRAVARVAQPLVRQARLKDISGASFSVAFFSGVAANTMLAEAYEQGRLTRREVVLSNLFNSLPTYFLHLPTLFFIAAPFIGPAAGIYVGLTAVAAVLRTGFIVLLGRLWLPPLAEGCVVCRLDEMPAPSRMASALHKTWARFKKRLPKILYFTVPIYTLFYFLKVWGLFQWMDTWAEAHVRLLAWLPPEAMGIIVFHMAAEFTAGLAAAGALVQAGSLTTPELVLALMAGNVLSSPMRAVRHQFPYYAGIFRPALAARLIVYSQILRASSIALVAAAYAWLV